jgi:FkbM family methyltransferase
VPNLGLRIPHVEERKRLAVRCREHLGLIVRGAKAYEAQYVEALRKIIKQDQTVFDIGANIGFYSVLFSGWVGPNGRVIAYEPDPDNLKLLRRNLELNNCRNVVVRPVALAAQSGNEIFSIDPVTHMTGHLGAGATYAATIFGNSKENLISVPTSTLDEEVTRFGAPDIIKMDIEGGEYDALRGGAALLQTDRPIIVSEMNTWGAQTALDDAAPRQPATLLSEHNYSLWNLDSGLEAGPDSIPWMVIATPKEMDSASRRDATAANA